MNKQALITGGTSGIGAAFARRLAAEGHDVILTGRREPQLATLCRELEEQFGISATFQTGDLARAEDRQALEDRIRALPRLDVLINNAGYAEDGRFGDIDWPRHQALLDVHVQATMQLTHAALPQLLEQRGTVINVASVASWLPTPQSALYGPTKAFVRSFSETLALSYHPDGLKVQALCPGFTVTDFHQKLGIDPASFYRSKGLVRAWTADQVVDRSLNDLARGRIVCIPGWNYRLIVTALRHLPMSLLHWAQRRAKVARYGAD
ncbi:SDR family NAD(P)-dependent oxidoreductase [Saccharospirillum salsuginis]|uniref:Dehydrogenase n=1 Tax=Saccharospirillum salsuginis TaxID=418750 RepID=A0A918KU23_9GAMM|nr:SDR family oxidoreductase [Saccharospirillum salsuginis]GGX73422.1 dehydrogenase [Saccharospirillum salsuginis]